MLAAQMPSDFSDRHHDAPRSKILTLLGNIQVVTLGGLLGQSDFFVELRVVSDQCLKLHTDRADLGAQLGDGLACN